MSDLVIRAEKLGKRFRIGAVDRNRTLRDWIVERARRIGRRETSERAETTIWALRDVDLELRRGQVLGIIGRNGAGKSTLLKVLCRITRPTTGRGEVRGRVASLLEVGTGFHPELTGRENVFLNGAILGMSRAEIRAKLDEIISFAEVERFVDTPVKRYSSGMYLRLAFAVAAHLEPEILIVDEVLAVGDMAFQKKCLGKMEGVASAGRTILFVSHNMDAIRTLCSDTLVLSQGEVTFLGRTPEAVRRYLGVAGHGSGETALALHSTEIDISAIRTVGADGTPAREFDFRSGGVIEIGYHAKLLRGGLAIGLVVSDEQGHPVFTSSTRALTGDDGLPAGRGIAAVRIPGYFLSPGEYTIFVNAHTPFEAFCSEPDALTFSVREVGREVLGRYGNMKWPGSISPRLDWSLSESSRGVAEAVMSVGGEA